MSKIKEVIVEPSKTRVGSNPKLKIKAIRYLTYEEIKTRKVLELKKITVSEMRGE